MVRSEKWIDCAKQTSHFSRLTSHVLLTRTRIANARTRFQSPPKPLMIWDGECHFCKRWIDAGAKSQLAKLIM